MDLKLNMLATIIIVLPSGFALLVLKYVFNQYSHKVNPLTRNLRRPAGTALGKTLGGLQLETGFLYGMFLLSCSFPFTYLGILQLLGYQLNRISFFIIVVICIFPALMTIRKLVNTFHSIKKVRLAYECELAVGQELDQLMLQGFHVFHDIQAGKFNIDHVVVGKTGVFAVETKGRSKRANSRGEGKEEYKVNYENGVLHFPGWQEVEPLKQAEIQAKWLADDLSKSTGIELNVSGVVVLPGWFINMSKPQGVPVLAVGSIPRFFSRYVVQELNDKDIKQIVYQLDQRSRDLAPGELSRPTEV